MAWIESHQALEKHPKVMHLHRLMGWSLDETIGKLHRFWWWCLDYAPTGDLRNIDSHTLANGIGLEGEEADKFMPAMMTSHWICSLKGGKLPFRVHDWVEYAGRYLRDTKFRRHPEKLSQVMELYKITCQPTVSRQSAASRRIVGGLSAVPDLTNPPNLTNQTYLESFVLFWGPYPNKDGKDPATKAWMKLKPDQDLMQTIMQAVERLKSTEKWMKDNGKFIPMASTFLNQRRWEDQGVLLPLKQERCIWANDPCEAYAVEGSKYCKPHRDIIRNAPERIGIQNDLPIQKGDDGEHHPN